MARSAAVVKIECPECGYKEITSFTPTISLGFSADVTITEVVCDECGYRGEPGEPVGT